MTAAAVQVVGVTLVVAGLVSPGAISVTLSRTIGGSHIIAVFAVVLSGVAGLYVSFWADIASGPVVVLTSTMLYLVVLVTGRIFHK